MKRPSACPAMSSLAHVLALSTIVVSLMPAPGAPATADATPAHGDESVRRGAALFAQSWSMAPSAFGRWGRGPTSNGEACTDCHAEAGRGRPPLAPDQPLRQGVVRLSIATARGPQAHPVYGEQLQYEGVLGKVPGEGEVLIEWSEHPEHFADGSTIRLRKPAVRFASLGFGDIGADTLISLRLAPPLRGVAAFEDVDAQALEQSVAAQGSLDLDGRINRLTDGGNATAGRFGLKANQPGLTAQIASALHQDLGVTSPLHPQENCPDAQRACRDSIAGTQPEIALDEVEALADYLRSLPPPARRARRDATSDRGAALFASIGCAGCHRPALPLRDGAGSIHAYTDLLVHDLGEGLADGRPDGQAGARDWRTAPLWGLGGQGDDMVLLHDGRARSIAEAILWHDGEARAAREQFRAMPESDREALTSFLRTL